MKDSLHSNTDRLVVRVQRPGILGVACWPEFLGSSQQWFDSLIPQHDERGDRLQSLRDRLIPACVVDAAEDLLASEFVQILGGAARAVLGLAVVAECWDVTGQLGSREPAGSWRESNKRLGDPAHARLIQIDSAHFRFADLRRRRELFQHFIGDETLINAALEHPGTAAECLRLGHALGKLLQRTATPEFLGVVDDRFNAKHALAFGINLQSQLAAVQLEDCQILRRFLDRYFPFG